MPFDACNPDRPCAICGNTNQYCSFSPDGGIMCRKGLFDGPDGRPAKEKYDKQGSPFWQWLPKSDNAPATYTQESACKAAPVEQLDRVYREMFSRLNLTKAHKEALLARGLVEADLVHFRSLAREDRKVAQHLANLFPFWQQVPGLYVTPTGKPMLGGAEGLLRRAWSRSRSPYSGSHRFIFRLRLLRSSDERNARRVRLSTPATFGVPE